MEDYSKGSDIRQALQQTVKLSDGRNGCVFTELPQRGMQQQWHCHICGKQIESERALLIHIGHPIHRSNLRVTSHPPKHFSKFVYNKGNEHPGNNWSLDILPGEPVPPGMEDSISQDCQLQRTLDEYTAHPLIGLEYIVELISSDKNIEPRYVCLLCEKKGDPRSVLIHLKSYSHYIKYISCFFRTAGNAINMMPKNPETRKGINVAVVKVAELIEKHFGRLKPTIAAAETFQQKKFEILAEIDKKEHFRETPNTTFIHLVTAEKIKEYAQTEAIRIDSEIRKPVHQTPMPKIEPKQIPTKPVIKTEKNAKKIPPEPIKFKIGKPEKVPKGNRPNNVTIKTEEGKEEEDDDDDVIVIGDQVPECIELNSLSSLSSISSIEDNVKSKSRRKIPKDRFGRTTSPHARDKHRSPSYSRRYSRSRSRSRERYRRESSEKYRRSRGYSREKERRRRDISSERRRRDRTPERRRKDFSDERKRRAPSYDRYSAERSRWSRDRMAEPHKRAKDVDNQAKFIQYRTELKRIELDLEESLKYFEDRPEKHPAYAEEWKGFWNRRYKEIQNSGKDPTTYDFKPEWIIFWSKRMKEINVKDLEKKKEELRKKLDIDFHSMQGPSSDLQDISPPTPEKPDITVDDVRNTWKAMTGSDISVGSRYSPPHRRYSPGRRYDDWSDYPKYKTNNVVPPVLHALRMLSILENILGSLAPRTVELLSKALVMERTRVGECMSMLEDEDIIVFFDTCKEKIRGASLAGIVEHNLVSTARKLIVTIEKMIALAPPPKISYSKSTKAKPIHPVQVPGIGMIDKVAIANQIASALVAQGRTDVTTEQLEELINAVVGIAQATNATVTDNSNQFLCQLNIDKSTARPAINQILGNMISTAQKAVVEEKKEVEPEPVPVKDPTPEPVEEEPDPSNDKELQMKMMNFRNLSVDEQRYLISYLKELEATNPDKVEGLRKYVAIGISKAEQVKVEPPKVVPVKEVAVKPVQVQPVQQATVTKAVVSDDDDDDYSFEDVFKAASEKVKYKETKNDDNSFGSESNSVNKPFNDALLKTIQSFTNKIPETETSLDSLPGFRNSYDDSRLSTIPDFLKADKKSETPPLNRPPMPVPPPSFSSFNNDSNPWLDDFQPQENYQDYEAQPSSYRDMNWQNYEPTEQYQEGMYMDNSNYRQDSRVPPRPNNYQTENNFNKQTNYNSQGRPY